MMVVFLPFVGVGLFGAKLGALAAVFTLIQHLVYGVTLGATYGLLATWAPEKAPERSQQT
jgi:hypothetical protein